MKKVTSERGYVGLLALLIGVAIMCFLMVKVFVSTHSARPPAYQPNAQGLTPIQQAQDAKKMLEKNNSLYSN